MRKLAVLALVLAALCWSALPLAAIQYEGCYNCVYDPKGMTGPSSWVCDHVGHAESGEGIYCEELCFMGVCFCETIGGACYNVVVTCNV